MDEIWKEIFSHTNYEISTLGLVRRKNTNKLMKPNKCSLGYLSVTLTKNNNPTKFLVHRLVATTFLPNYYNKPTVNHKNKNTSDNRIWNLEWATNKEQNIHKNKDKTETNTFYICTMKPIWRIDMKTNQKIEKYNNLSEAQDWCIKNKLSISKNIKNGISLTALGKRNHALGFKWEYETNNYIDLENEIWKEVPKEFINNYTNSIKISNLGRIKYGDGTIGVGFKYRDYLGISIGGKIYMLHRLVAQVFLNSVENKYIVNHKDGNKLNSNLSNLEWVNYKENSFHAYETGLNKSRKPVIQFDIMMNKINEFKSLNEASDKLNINATNIGSCCRGRTKTCGGFRFMFKEDYKPEIDYLLNFKKHINNKEIIQFDLSFNKLEEYSSVSSAAKKLSINRSGIDDCCNGKQKTANGFIFMFKITFDSNNNYIVQKKTRAKKIAQFDQEMNKLNVFSSISEAAKQLNINDSNISSCCKGKRKTTGGYIFSYL
jgi:plasmid maintenance system antidote protein VapI